MVLPTPEQENHDDRRNEDFMQRLNAALIKNEMLDEVKELTPQGLKKTFSRKKNRYVRSDGSHSHIPLLEETTSTPMNGWGNGMRLGMEMAGGPIVGLGIGHMLDKWLDTEPLCLLVFLVLGLAAGFLNVYRMIKQEEDPWIKGHHEALEQLDKRPKKR
jgi:F0F1-type ATP synthase assembly protein I